MIHVSPSADLTEPFAAALPPPPAPSCDWTGLRWYALVTNPRCEDRAAAGLRAKGLEVFAPEARRWVKPHRATEWHQAARPLLPRYLFIGFDDAPRWHLVFTTHGIHSIVCDGSGPRQIPAGQIVNLYARITAGEFDQDARPRRRRLRYRAGDMVAVTVPGMENATAVIRKTPRPSAERILVEMLGKSVVVPVDRIAELPHKQGRNLCET